VSAVPNDDDGETETATPKDRANTEDVNAQRPPFRATQFINYKPCFFRDENSKDGRQAKDTAFYILGSRAERAFQVRVSVPSLVSSNGIPWTVDTICRVYLPVLGIDEEMWISERTMSQDVNGGQRTELVLLPKGYVVIGEP
jgi:prophage tail gpP-like protein